MDNDTLTQLLRDKIEWMGKVFEAAYDCDEYKWTKLDVRHRCGGQIYVFVETTGIGYVCEKCKEAEVL